MKNQDDTSILSSGVCRFGVSKVALEITGKHPMAGFSWSGKTAVAGKNELFARALSLQDIETGERIVFVIVDLLSGSLRLLQEVHELLGPGAGLRDRVVLCGTHTHNAPGRYFGNRFYDRFASAPRLKGFDKRVTRELATGVAKACTQALASEQEGLVSIHRALIVEAGNNRSLIAFQAARRDEHAPPLNWLTNQQGNVWPETVDPRLTVIRAEAQSQVKALFGWYGCHATAVGLTSNKFDRDWPGAAVDQVEREIGTCICAVGAGAGGDVSPLPKDVLQTKYQSRAELEKAARRHQGQALAQQVGGAIASGLRKVASAHVASSTPLPVQVNHGLFEVQTRGSTSSWQIGAPALIGAEDGASAKIPGVSVLVSEGFASGDGPHAPKAPALGSLQAQLSGFLDVASFHPWHVVRLGNHVLFSVPGEPTVNAAAHLEHAVAEAHAATSASVIGYAGDYVGYFTTPAEYQAQQYEGASTLYGQWSLAWYREQLLGPSRALPRVKGVPELVRSPLRRRVNEVSAVARQLKTSDERRVSLLFSVPNVVAPRTAKLVTQGSSIDGVLRPYPNPDPSLKHDYQTYTAEFASRNEDYRLEDAELQVNGTNGYSVSLSIELAADVEANHRLPVSCKSDPSTLGWLRRLYLVLAVVTLGLGFVSQVFAPLILGAQTGQEAHPFDVLMFRAFNLSFFLLTCNLWFTKNATDFKALRGCALALAAFALAQAFVVGHCLGSVPGGAFALVVALGLSWLSQRIKAQAPKRDPAPHYGGFARSLYGVGAITLSVGAFLLIAPGLFANCVLDKDALKTHSSLLIDPEDWLRAYGAGFLVNTISMWMSAQTRDLRVVRGQFAGSWWFDALSAVYFSFGVFKGYMSKESVVLLFIFAGFAVLFTWLRRTVNNLDRYEVSRPRTTEELVRLVQQASANGQVVRVVGSGHSVRGAILGWRGASPRGKRPSEHQTVHVSLEYMDQVLEVDRERQLITVQAGMHLGEDPNQPSSTSNNLLCHLKELGWALHDLGGVAHQTIAGFISTGSSGGSLKHSFQDNLWSMRFVDGNGQVHEVRRAEPDFDAICVSMGLLGIITEVTFECEERYFIRGREYAASVDRTNKTADVSLSPSCIEGGEASIVNLLSPKGDGLAAFLARSDSCRILWWPQAQVSKMAIWEGHRTTEVPNEEELWDPGGVWAQLFAASILRRIGWSYGFGLQRSVGVILRRRLVPLFAKFFIPATPKNFYAGWDVILPMDDRVDDALLPVDFTELWFPIENTANVMKELFDMYEDPETAGGFVVELYAAKSSPAWLSPAYARNCFRVDVFWFRNNHGDPVLEYFPRFWDRLQKYAFRAHWGKYLPRPGSGQGPHYWAESYPRWQDFHETRERLDPYDVFLSEYWRAHLGKASRPRVSAIHLRPSSPAVPIERGEVSAR